MKVLILYYSATGNTRLAVSLIREGVESSPGDTCDLAGIGRGPVPPLDGYDVVGFAAPVFCFKPAIILLQMIDSLPEGGGRPCFTFWTSGGGPANSDWIAQRKLAARGWRVIAQRHMTAQDSWTTGKVRAPDPALPSVADRRAAREFGAGLAGLADEARSPGFALPEPVFRPGVMHAISKFYEPWMLDAVFRTDVDMARCTRCGRCVRDCPTGRMRFDAFPRPRGRCVGCYRCINLCPEGAIEGWMTRGKPRYKGPAGEAAV